MSRKLIRNSFGGQQFWRAKIVWGLKMFGGQTKFWGKTNLGVKNCWWKTFFGGQQFVGGQIFADTCTNKFLYMLMGWAKRLDCADTGARTPSAWAIFLITFHLCAGYIRHSCDFSNCSPNSIYMFLGRRISTNPLWPSPILDDFGHCGDDKVDC